MIASTFATSAAQAATPKPPKNSAQKQARTPEKKSASSAVPQKDRDTVLGKGWKTSTDRAVTAVADSDGLHLLAADSTTGYDWKTVTVLSEPQLPADTWIGNSCVMDDHHAAVAYAPRTFTNKPDLMMGGAFTAIVNLDDGSVTKLPFTASLAYFDPTCNPATHTAVFTALHDAKTRLVTVNAKGTTVADTTANGEITSAVPTKDGVVAAAGNRLVHVDRKGKTAELAATKHAPYGIRVTGDGRVSYIDRTGDTDANVQTYAHGKKTTVASGQIAAMNLRQGTDGTVYLTGKASHGKGFTSSGIKTLGVSPDAEVSTHGRLAVDPVVSPAVLAGVDRINNAGRGFTKTASKEPAAETTPGHISHVLTITGAVPGTGKHTKQKAAEPGSTAGGTPSPTLTGSSKPQMSTMSVLTTAADSRANDPVDSDRWCSVPRNDVATQALQPTPNQVEWAVDMAVQGNLRSGYLTQGGWRSQTGISTIDPQGLFPKPALTGGGRIPAQVQLGILAQESNLWQAESGAIPGQMGSPLAAVDGFYGHETGGSLSDFWAIHWNLSDCGYGVGQVTDGMRLAGYEKEHETSLPVSTQRAVAIDYTTNIAASLYILADKWNEVHESGQTIAVNNDDPAKPENWFTAVWNYNLGFNKKADEATNGNWGLGWYNNPANPVYPASRLAFMNTDLDPLAAKDAAHPQNWPYEEKVMGWASWSIDTGHSYATSGRQDWPGESGFSSAGFRPAYWNGTNGTVIDQASAKYHRAHATPPLDAFCNTKNNCDTANPPDCPDADCYKQYWWHESSTTWKSDCATSCGFENIKYVTAVSEPGRGTRLQYGTPVCSGAPSGAKVVDSVPAGTNTWSSCGTTTTDGSFKFTFYPDPNATGPGLGQYDAKADLHQIGGGYQGHFWYTHARDADHLGGDAGRMTILGDWQLNSAISGGQAKVYVHIPDTGAQVPNASYKIITPFDTVTKTIDQGANASNTWVSLGAYNFKDQPPHVQLSNSTADGAADKDVAYGAVAFVPGDYSDMPNIIFPNPDDSAPMPSWEGDVEEAHRNTGLTSAATALRGAPTITANTTCSPSRTRGGKICVNIGKAQPRTSRLGKQMTNSLSAAGVNSIVPWCDARTAGHDWYTRTDACLKSLSPLNVIFLVDEKVVGTAHFAMQQEIKLYNNIGEFDQTLSLVPTEIDPTMGAVTLGWDAGSTCSDCTQSQQQTDGSLTWAGPEDGHVGNVSFQTLWNGTGKEEITLGWGITGRISAYPEASGEADLGNTLGDLDVRCDDMTKGAANAGCVFPAYTPTFTVNTDRYPAAGAYYWLMKEKNSNHYGSRAHKTPLHYLRDGQTDNRNVVCPDSWVGRIETPNASCDEYAFATTNESAGVPDNGVTKGDECAQYYATPLNDTIWTLYYDNNYRLPTWSEKCGRASIPLGQNTGALAPFGRTGGFVWYNRMLGDDPFWLATPGFDHCTSADTSCTFQRTNP
ncbi:Tat pathway signal protein [Streptomyces sp. NBC_01764]|uniref:golvesin C-terminal-like domain-containing protein n=1 Tax=Streptomyces sp. NBC_01764 TaxID=2975935 RepID=UPI00225266BC|nr:Tat pathway signal protein [Streptomyces sp. NBC_01764]MCX4406436.1 Tat pathway signal protein [Streptomyces sp. NBC_01764]